MTRGLKWLYKCTECGKVGEKKDLIRHECNGTDKDFDVGFGLVNASIILYGATSELEPWSAQSK